MSYRIIGRIIAQETGEGIPGLRVQAWDKDMGNLDEYLGEIITSQNGEFVIEYTDDQFDQWGIDEKPDIYLLVSNKKGAIIYSTENAIRYDAAKEEAFNIQISKALLSKEPDMNPEDFFSQLVKRLSDQ